MPYSHAGAPAHEEHRPAELEPEVIRVTERVVACDGGIGPLGHPRVWLRIMEQQTSCPWCSRIFLLEGDVQDTGH